MYKGTLFRLDLIGNAREKYASGADVINSSLRQILMTPRNQRIMLPEFGSNLKYLLFEPKLDDALKIQIKREIKSVVNRWDDRIKVTDIGITSLQSGVKVKVFWQLRDDPRIRASVDLEYSD